MSAIWGIIDFNGNKLDQNVTKKLSDGFSGCKIDKIQDIYRDNYYMASGVQYFNYEAQFEKFPYTYIDSKTMVADAIIDNRKEMLLTFDLQSDLSRKGIDGSILYEAIADNLRQALDKLCGAFVFVEYDESEKKVYVANDVVGTRSVYYSFLNGRFIFSSLINPIIPYLDSVEVEEEWLSKFIDNDNLLIVDSASLTPYKGIYRLEPGELLVVSDQGIDHISYWDPRKKAKELKLKTDEEYKTLVLDTFKKCVVDVIREPGETGILLSGGLDSNAVAAYAAPYLKKKGRKLFSYTSVPNDEIEPIPNNSYYVKNERIYIEKLREYHTNLIPKFINTSEIDTVAEFEKVSKLLETPVKTVVNVPWIYEAVKQAELDGCKILLGGQYGNGTISYGYIQNLFATLKFSGRLIKLVKAINNYGKKNIISRKKLLKYVLKIDKKSTLKKARGYMYDKIALRQVGESELHESLLSGVVFRDPTRDRRLIELTLSIPIDIFVNADTDRRLVREYMKNIIPPEIVSDQFHRGSQGDAGFDNIRVNWRKIKDELIPKYNLNTEKKYLWKQELCKWIEQIDESAESNNFKLMKAIYLGYLCEYLNNIESLKDNKI